MTDQTPPATPPRGPSASPSDVLLALADRAEREEPSRDLDAGIAKATGWSSVSLLDFYGSRDPSPASRLVEIPRYTASLDAAVTPEGDDVFWRSGHDGEGPDPSLFKAEVLICHLSHPAAGFVGRAKTEAMARRAAELRARAALLEEKK